MFFSGLENLLPQFQSTFQSYGSTVGIFEAISSFIEICTNTIDTLYRTQYVGQVDILLILYLLKNLSILCGTFKWKTIN